MAVPLTMDDLTGLERGIVNASIATFFCTVEAYAPLEGEARLLHYEEAYERYAATIDLTSRMVGERLKRKIENGLL
jgi:HSP20 family molecular chaperone IbpA